MRHPLPLSLGPSGGGTAVAEPYGPRSLWLVDAVTQGPAALGLAPAVLDEREKRRAAAFRRDGDRRCYVTAHVALRVLLGAHLGTEPGGVRLVAEDCPSCGGPHGRPAAADAELHFSLSHSQDLVLLAFARSPVGVDVEALLPPEAVDDVAAELHPRETAELATLPPHARPVALARAWVRKEAYLKGLGIGLAHGIAADYVGTGRSPGPAPPGWSVADVAVPPGFAAAVAESL